MPTLKKVAIIGAGISGLVAARLLADAHIAVTVFDKSRGVGGRVATRYAKSFEFDHGAQYITAQTPAFRKLLVELQAAGVVAPWEGSLVTISDKKLIQSVSSHSHYVGIPRMNAFPKYLARGLDIVLNHQVNALIQTAGGWQLQFTEGNAACDFDWVILAIPPAQAQMLLPQDSCLMSKLKMLSMQACYTLMLGFADSLQLSWRAANITQSCIQWIAVNSSKPGRNPDATLVILADNQWSDNHIADNAMHIENELRQATSKILKLPSIVHSSMHRWLYAKCVQHPISNNLVDYQYRLALCGDWTEGRRVEAAYWSGKKSAKRIIDAFR